MPVVKFVCQGAEPILLGIDFINKVIELQKAFPGLKIITKSEKYSDKS